MSDPSTGVGRPTLRTVAERAGVSVAVVSYSFSRPDRVAKATRRRVLAAADELGYPGPNPAARALRTGKTGVIGLLFDGSDGDIPARVGAVTPVLLRACAKRNLSLILPTGKARPPLDGVIILRPLDPGQVCENEPHLWIGPGEPRRANEVSGGPEGAREAVDEMKRRGHTRVAFVGDPGIFPLCESKAAAYGPEAMAVAVPEESYAAGTEAAAKLLSAPAACRPTALFVMGSALAFGARKAADAAGIGIPEDLSLVALDDVGTLPHDLTAVGVPITGIVETAVDLLRDAIGGGSNDRGSTVPTEYHPGSTLGDVPVGVPDLPAAGGRSRRS